MSLDADALYALLPAVYRTRDAACGAPLRALFAVVATQAGIVEENIVQLYDDQFIETCMPWVIPYIGDLLGYEPVSQTSAGLDSRAEVANLIGYRRRKGTRICLQQMAADVSGRPAFVVEEFRRLITTQSMRLPRPYHAACLNLRDGAMLDRLGDSAFDTSNRTLDVRRIAPRVRMPPIPDPAALDIALHGPGRFDVPDVAMHLWRCRPWRITRAPAFVVDARRFRFHPLGLDIPLFSVPAAATQPFERINNRLDVPQPIRRGEFARQRSDFYGPSLMLYADGSAIDAAQILCANLADLPGGAWCVVPPGKIAIDPELGRIQFADDLTPPQSLRVTYAYGLAAALGGGPYDRTGWLGRQPPTEQPADAQFFALVGATEYPDLASAVARWNQQPPGAAGLIVLPGFERHVVDLTGEHAIVIASGSILAVAAATPVPLGGPRDVSWNHACATLVGNLEVKGAAAPFEPEGRTPPAGQFVLNGLLIGGQLRIGESDSAAPPATPLIVQVSDCTLAPGPAPEQAMAAQGEPAVIVRDAAALCIARCITGPVAASAAGSVRVTDSIIDANSPCCVAYAGVDGRWAGADLHVEGSTVIGKVSTRTLQLASNTIFHARLARRDPWPAALWCRRRQTGCVRFCSLPRDAITPRRYECLPPDSADGSAAASATLSASFFAPSFEPVFVSLRYGEPGYALLSGDVPVAIWRGADDGSQIGAYHQSQETEAVANVQVRAPEYLPAMLESGVFLHPSRTLPRPQARNFTYAGARLNCCGDDDDEPPALPGIGAGLL